MIDMLPYSHNHCCAMIRFSVWRFSLGAERQPPFSLIWRRATTRFLLQGLNAFRGLSFSEGLIHVLARLVAAVRAGRTHRERRVLWWLAAISEVLAWWLLMQVFLVGLLEAYTLPFAALALMVGALENRYRPDLGSWVTYGPGLAAALVPSLLLVVTTGSPDPVRQIWVILAGVATLLLGSRLRQRAPLIIGSAVTAIAALHLLSLAGPWLILIPIGVLLLALGAGREKRQRDLERLRGAYSRMR
jgi:hypothetical protein